MNNKSNKPKAQGGIFQPISGGNGVIVLQKNGRIRAYALKKAKSGSSKK